MTNRTAYDIYCVINRRPRLAGTYFATSEMGAIEAKAKALCFPSVEAMEIGLKNSYRALPELFVPTLTNEGLLAFCTGSRGEALAYVFQARDNGERTTNHPIRMFSGPDAEAQANRWVSERGDDRYFVSATAFSYED